MAAESVQKTFFIAFALCVVCSVLVSSAAVILKPRQTLNKELDIKKNLLLSAGLLQQNNFSKAAIEEAYKKISPLTINLTSGERVISTDNSKTKGTNLSPGSKYTIPAKKDLARIKIRSKYATVYLVRENSKTTQIVLPVHGKGLYSTLYGFLTLAIDTNTITGFSFYDHGETPGLGGEVDSPRWKAQWPGKTVYNNQWQPNIQVVKGGVPAGSKDIKHQVDAISGASLTSRGVENLLRYWLGNDGYGPFLAKIRNQGINI